MGDGKKPQLSPFGNALAGAIGGVVSNAIVYPLDTVKTRIQASSSSSNPSTSTSTSAPSTNPPLAAEFSSSDENNSNGVDPTTGRPRARRSSSISRANSPSISLNPDGSLNRRSSSFSGKDASLFRKILFKSAEKAEKAVDTSLGGQGTDVGAMEIIKRIWKENGIEGFYRGFGANMLNTFSMQFAYFYWYTVVRTTYITRVQKAPKKGLSVAMELLLGALAGMLAQIFTIPVSVIATRQQLSLSESAPTLLTTLREILAEDGITGLWRGLKPSLVLTVNPAITYGVFERLKNIVISKEGEKLGPGKSFVVGAGSKTLATVVTYPYIMAKVRLQARYKADSPSTTPTKESNGSAAASSSSSSSPPEVIESSDAQVVKNDEAETKVTTKEKKKEEKYKGAIDVLVKVWKERGFFGWYQGMQAQITKAVLSQALLFGIKDYLEDYTLLLMLAFYAARNKAATKAAVVAAAAKA